MNFAIFKDHALFTEPTDEFNSDYRLTKVSKKLILKIAEIIHQKKWERHVGAECDHYFERDGI